MMVHVVISMLQTVIFLFTSMTLNKNLHIPVTIYLKNK